MRKRRKTHQTDIILTLFTTFYGLGPELPVTSRQAFGILGAFQIRNMCSTSVIKAWHYGAGKVLLKYLNICETLATLQWLSSFFHIPNKCSLIRCYWRRKVHNDASRSRAAIPLGDPYICCAVFTWLCRLKRHLITC